MKAEVKPPNPTTLSLKLTPKKRVGYPKAYDAVIPSPTFLMMFNMLFLFVALTFSSCLLNLSYICLLVTFVIIFVLLR